MNPELQTAIEKVFRNSSSPDELFDAFRSAIIKKVDSVDLYKILLANPALSKDEIIMFTEKIIREFPELTYGISMWTAGVFENNLVDYSYRENSIKYYTKALFAKPTDCDPLIKLIRLHSSDVELPENRHILDIIDAGLPGVHKKSKVYYELAGLFKKLGDRKKETDYLALAEESVKRERKN